MLHRSRTWAHFALIVVVLLSLSVVSAQDQPKPEAVGLRPDAPTYALHGPYWVGVQLYDAETEFHDTTVAVWYPALNPTGQEESVTYLADSVGQQPEYGRALLDAAPDLQGGPYSLVIYSAGGYAGYIGATYLCEHLASQGFVVMSIDYADMWSNIGRYDGDLSVYSRPRDVSWQIDYADRLTAAGSLKGMIDTQKVAVVGHNFGAFTAFVASGARLDFNSSTSACVLYPDVTTPADWRPVKSICRDQERKLVQLAGLETAPDGLWPSWADPRVDAIVAQAPDMFSFGADSLENVTVPAMLMVATLDRFSLPDLPLYRPYLYDNLGSEVKSLVTFEYADNLLFGGDCAAAPWIVNSWGQFWVCADAVWDMDRAHDLTNHFTTAFLLDVLKGDKEAHAALAPDAVSFPGITYTAEGF